MQRIVVAGAGSAGSGVILTIRNAMNKRYGLTKEEATSRFFIMDKYGLRAHLLTQVGALTLYQPFSIMYMSSNLEIM